MSSKLATELLGTVNRFTRSDCFVAKECVTTFDSQLEEIREVLTKLKCGGACWCVVGDFVNTNKKHSESCELAQELSKLLEVK